MKFKSEEGNVEISVEQTPKCKDNCDLCKALDIASAQIDLIYSILSSIRTSIETVKALHEKHDTE